MAAQQRPKTEYVLHRDRKGCQPVGMCPPPPRGHIQDLTPFHVYPFVLVRGYCDRIPETIKLKRGNASLGSWFHYLKPLLLQMCGRHRAWDPMSPSRAYSLRFQYLLLPSKASASSQYRHKLGTGLYYVDLRQH